jgi:hypothetical protein
MKTYGERSYSSTIFYLGRFISGETTHGVHFIGDWVGPRAGINSMEERKISCHYLVSNLDSSVYPVA